MTETPTTFDTILSALQAEQVDFTRPYLQHFSDLEPRALKSLLEIWPRISLTRKHKLLEGLLSLLDSDTLVSFEELGRALLADSDPSVRAAAIQLLSESDDPKLVRSFIDIVQKDPVNSPRLAAIERLGEFVMLGELEELPAGEHRAAESALLAVANGEDQPVLRRKALEALGYSGRPEVQTLIESAYRRQDPEWVASALVAMGRSSDERWEESVLGMLLNDDPRIRLAAVESSGALSLDAAGPILLSVLEDEEEEGVTAAAVWSLSQIGGEEARLYLQSLLDQAADPEQTAFLEDALDNLAFTDELNSFELMAYDPEEIDED